MYEIDDGGDGEYKHTINNKYRKYTQN